MTSVDDLITVIREGHKVCPGIEQWDFTARPSEGQLSTRSLDIEALTSAMTVHLSKPVARNPRIITGALNLSNNLMTHKASAMLATALTEIHTGIQLLDPPKRKAAEVVVIVRRTDNAPSNFRVAVRSLNLSNTNCFNETEPWIRLFEAHRTAAPSPTSFDGGAIEEIICGHEALISSSLHPLFTSMGSSPWLRKIVLPYCGLDCDAVAALGKGIQQCATASRLAELDLQHNNIGASGVVSLMAAFPTSSLLAVTDPEPCGLRRLTLSYNNIAKLTSTNPSDNKKFGRTGYDPRGLLALASFVRCCGLVLLALDLSHNELGRPAMATAPQNKEFCNVSMHSAVGADQGGVSELCEAARNCQCLSELIDLRHNGFSARTKESLKWISGSHVTVE